METTSYSCKSSSIYTAINNKKPANNTLKIKVLVDCLLTLCFNGPPTDNLLIKSDFPSQLTLPTLPNSLLIFQ